MIYSKKCVVYWINKSIFEDTNRKYTCCLIPLIIIKNKISTTN